MHAFGEYLEEAVQYLVPLLGIELFGEVHRPLHVGEEDCHLLPLALESGARRENLLGEVLWSVGTRFGGWSERSRADGLATLQAELGSSRQLGTARSAAMVELPAALEAEAGVLRIFGSASPTAHLEPRYKSPSSSAFASFKSAASKPSVNQP